MAVVGLGGWCLHWWRRHGAPALDWVVVRQVAFTGLLFLPEISFALSMQHRFQTQTQSEGGIYFVPDDPRHATNLAMTPVANVCVVACLACFLCCRLYARTLRPAS